MIYCNGTILKDKTVWEIGYFPDEYRDHGVTINFPLPFQLDAREAFNYIKAHLQDEERKWLSTEGEKWRIDLDAFRMLFGKIIDDAVRPNNEPMESGMIFFEPPLSKISSSILAGILFISPEFNEKNTRKVSQSTVRLIITYDMILAAKPKRIFLSHKSADKPLVREFRDTLRLLGFEPWMDEDDLKAGDKLHRGILQGFKESCAAIFFITPNYKDDRYLATEIDYAITEATNKGQHFRIITLVIADDATTLQVPKLLEQFVYKHPQNKLEALRVIIKAIPLKLGAPQW